MLTENQPARKSLLKNPFVYSSLVILIVAIVVAYFTCIFVIGFLAVPAVMAYAAYDAFQGAKKWNVANGFPAGA